MFISTEVRNTVQGGSVELRDALAAMDGATEAILLAEEQRKAALLALRDAARRYLMGAGDDLLARCDLVYWQMLDVPVGIIAAVLLGDEKKAPLVGAMMPNASPPGIGCDSCGEAMTFATRSALLEFRSGLRSRRRYNSPALCVGCQQAHQQVRSAQVDDYARKVDERIHQLRSMPYKEYLLSEHWLETRNRKLKQARFQCQLCNAPWPLEVHHRTYERRGCEDMADLTVLCRPCHAKFHDKLP